MNCTVNGRRIAGHAFQRNPLERMPGYVSRGIRLSRNACSSRTCDQLFVEQLHAVRVLAELACAEQDRAIAGFAEKSTVSTSIHVLAICASKAGRVSRNAASASTAPGTCV
ncbi:hypothetical protein HT746_05500 [Burkholderia pyrrocinia]|uniref:hypothetical protein n=1 Tax=Burkholderia pyrrocinia TaxID=60550 RepID=UPI001575A414|nr:hypothetical protein [Burkholderia pyrrocinia]NTX26598.1 hypothetical protein [Burkholderia pyrrocinia]